MREVNFSLEKKLPVLEEGDIISVRQEVRTLAQEWGFDSFATSAVTTIASELARNIWNYAEEGEVNLRVREERFRVGLYMEFIDKGPGIDDLDRALAGGYSKGGSLGLGLAGSKRLADEFEIFSAADQGTRITAVKWRNAA
jgi:serine/threonine-protein kinase RsbT